MTLKRFNGSERRAYVRLEKSLSVRFKISRNSESQTYTATTKNISQGGLCLEIQQDRDAFLEKFSTAGHIVGIDINTLIPPQNKAVSAMSLWVNGRVDWAREPDQAHQALQVGLEFQDLTEEARKRIHNYILDEFLKRYPRHQ